MASEQHYYKHAETGIIALISDRAAEVFGDRLIQVDGPEDDKPARSRKKATDKSSDDSSKEGN